MTTVLYEDYLNNEGEIELNLYLISNATNFKAEFSGNNVYTLELPNGFINQTSPYLFNSNTNTMLYCSNITPTPQNAESIPHMKISFIFAGRN